MYLQNWCLGKEFLLDFENFKYLRSVQVVMEPLILVKWRGSSWLSVKDGYLGMNVMASC
jgi:hypothetical protein